MEISLQLMSLDALREIEAGVEAVDGVRLEDGALPPTFITTMAIKELESGRDALWCSYFLFVDREENRAVGSGGFRGTPQSGRVEIGYGVAPSCQGQGVATEAVNHLIELALGEPGVTEVFAETSVTNIASRRVVEKSGFKHIGQRESTDDGLVDQWLIVKPL